VEEVNDAQGRHRKPDLKGILEYNTELLVFLRFQHSTASSVSRRHPYPGIERTLVKVSSWYDNDGFSNRMLMRRSR